jgi:hypothetical protein
MQTARGVAVIRQIERITRTLVEECHRDVELMPNLGCRKARVYSCCSQCCPPGA